MKGEYNENENDRAHGNRASHYARGNGLCEFTKALENYDMAIRLNPRYERARLTCRKLLPTRSLKTEFAQRLFKLGEGGASANDIRNFLGYSRARTGQIEGDLQSGGA